LTPETHAGFSAEPRPAGSTRSPALASTRLRRPHGSAHGRSERSAAARSRRAGHDADLPRPADSGRAPGGRGGTQFRTPAPVRLAITRKGPRKPSRGAYRNRTGVNGFAGRCVATPPRRRGSQRLAADHLEERTCGRPAGDDRHVHERLAVLEDVHDLGVHGHLLRVLAGARRC
jgi:hypothetical protein